MSALTLMVMADQRVWVDADSLVTYLRGLEEQGLDQAEQARDEGLPHKFVAALAVKDAVRQIADSVILTTMEAREEVSSRVAGRSPYHSG